MAKFLSIKDYSEIFNKLRAVKNGKELDMFKRRISKRFGVPLISNFQLLKVYHKLLKAKSLHRGREIENLLKMRPIRSMSGVVNISVLTKEYPCPGKCLYCPKEKGIPKSYLSGEPAVERAKMLKFSPYRQTKERIESLEMEGHEPEKIEARIVGGTWSYYPKNYQTHFIKKIYDAANGRTGINLAASQKSNETAKHRIVALSVETRPDYINEDEIASLRNFGVTKVELGVQSIYNNVLDFVLRGHTAEKTVEASRLLKDAGFKLSYQMMLNLPKSSAARDFEMFKQIFGNSDFKPDYLKIYPLALLREAPLYHLYKNKKFKIYSESELIDLIRKIKQITPYWTRIERVIRDIPAHKIFAGGVKTSNLRQVIHDQSDGLSAICRCIRCREIKAKYNPDEKIYSFREDYESAGGREIFLSFESKDRIKLLSFLRLRIPSYHFNGGRHFLKVLESCAIIREIKSVGVLTPVGQTKRAPQHKGFGRRLLEEAEIITQKEFGIKKIAAIAAIGARQYFRKNGYRLKDTYMLKDLR